MDYTLFAGCSFTDGTGFHQNKSAPELWVNLLHNNVEALNKTQLLNVAKAGRSNAGIFSDAVYYLSKNNCKYAFVAWTSMPRYELEVGLETYDTRQCFIPNAPTRTHNLNDCKYDSVYLDSIRDRFTSLAHLHYEILNLVYYINSLIELAKLKKTKIFFINSLCPWDQEYFDTVENVLPNQYTKFTQQLLNVDRRDDDEIFQIYKKIHTQYQDYGGINKNYWLNLYSSMRHRQIDTNSNNIHPGINSNQVYYSQFLQALENKL